MNPKQVSVLQKHIIKYIKNKYKNNSLINDNLTDIEYLKLFDEKTNTVDDLLSAMFILPEGKLKKFTINLDDFNISEIFKINFNITNENIYNFLNLRHDLVSYIGFDLDRLLNIGCIRVGNDKINKEIFLQCYLIRKLHKNIYNIIEDCFLYYDNIIIDYIGDERQNNKFLRYSSKNGDTIKDFKKDINIIYNKLSIK